MNYHKTFQKLWLSCVFLLFIKDNLVIVLHFLPRCILCLRWRGGIVLESDRFLNLYCILEIKAAIMSSSIDVVIISIKWLCENMK